jgi:pimeloyl-ACP methyl ester carboxylesterase
MAYLDRGGVRIFYQVRGPSDGGLPLLLTHGFSASSAMWQPNIAALAAVRPVITWDLRGHVGAAGYLAAKLPRAAHAVIPDAGHACNIDQPDLFSQQVLAFLDHPDLR